MNATVDENSSYGRGASWASSDDSIATVDNQGKVTAVGKGTATITATAADNKTATCQVTVTEKHQGKVTGKKPGTVKITAAAGDKTATCIVIVRLSIPTNLKALSAGTTKAKISWTKVKGAEKYAVFYATSKNGKYAKEPTTTGSSYTKLKTGKTYYFKVRAYKSVGKTNVYGSYSKIVYTKVK
ncbi:MAG: fibronectin type III domain-containing protein [Anaerovoracaceae bacterium]